MPRRIGLLALVLAASTVLRVEPALASPPSSDPSEAPVEGPAPPPSEEAPSVEVPPPSISPGEGEGIEFATPLSEPGSEPPSLVPPPTSRREEIGKAPDSGAAFLAGGLWLVPGAAFGTWVFLLNNQTTQYEPRKTAVPIITAGAGLGAIGLAMIGVGVARQVQLRRWAKRHRVIALPQGSGLTTSGVLALSFGAAFLVDGIRTSDPVSGAIAGALLVSVPIQMAIGIRWALRYRRTDGWRATRWTLTPGGLLVRF